MAAGFPETPKIEIGTHERRPTKCLDNSASADAALGAGGHYLDCYRSRGDILDHRGDWTGAQKAYADAVALAPDLPAGYYSWGLALARHGDLAGAIENLKDANQRGPHGADPLKAWGDVLARQERSKEALTKYDEALSLATHRTGNSSRKRVERQPSKRTEINACRTADIDAGTYKVTKRQQSFTQQ